MSATIRLSALALAASLMALPVHAAEVDVFAAASMQTALDRIGAEWEAETGDTVRLTYAGSPQLARQIAEGAPADLFISASVRWMDELEKDGHIDVASRHDLLGNSLVLISGNAEAPKVDLGADTDLKAMLDGGKLAMALVDAVPAGVYGKEALTSLGLWDSVSADVAQVDNVRAALALVATGEAPYGIVYATDAKAEPKVSVVGTFPADSHAPITYPAALTKEGADKPQAKAFLDSLGKDGARDILTGEGFTVLVD